MWWVILFVLGTAFGSFLNVVSLRYNPDKSLFDSGVASGRSHCLHCKRQLSWFELVPIASFLLQWGRCRFCGVRLSPQYFIAEVVAGLITALVPLFLFANSFAIYGFLPLPILILVSFLWVVVFLALLLMALIDFRLYLIPDEINIILALLGVALLTLTLPNFSEATFSFIRSYAPLFGFRSSLWLNHLFGGLVGLLFFGVLILLTRGRGMGMGDLKLGVALGIVFGWPDILFIIAIAFVIGSFLGAYLIFREGRGLKSFLPFGPFLALAALLVFFFGFEMTRFYFDLFRLHG